MGEREDEDIMEWREEIVVVGETFRTWVEEDWRIICIFGKAVWLCWPGG